MARADRWIERLAQASAWAGALVLIALVMMTCVSIAGRALGAAGFGTGPIQGDFEFIEIGTGFAVFAFMPWCQYARGHAVVDLFQSSFGPRLNGLIDFIADLLMLLAAVVIAWRLWLGMLDKKGYFETTFILQVPVWIAYAAALAGAVVFAVTSAYCALRSGRALGHGKRA